MRKIKNSDSCEEATTERPSTHRAVITIETKHKILASLPSRLEISNTLSFKASAQLVNIARFSLVYRPKWYPQYEINHVWPCGSSLNSVVNGAQQGESDACFFFPCSSFLPRLACFPILFFWLLLPDTKSENIKPLILTSGAMLYYLCSKLLCRQSTSVSFHHTFFNLYLISHHHWNVYHAFSPNHPSHHTTRTRA